MSCSKKYLQYLMIIVPILNFLPGIGIDLYAPSLPAIASHMQISVMLAKNTITITMFGIAVGGLFFGALMDVVGRKKVIIFGLLIFMVASFLACFADNIVQLMIVRFIQGVMISTATIGSRTLVMDNFSGKQLTIAMLYTSIAYGLGPIIGPFVGGILQHYFFWQANFIAYGVFSIVLFLLVCFGVRDHHIADDAFHFKTILKNYGQVLCHRQFLAGIVILGGVLFFQLLFAAVGPFVVQEELGYSSIVYGNLSLCIGAAYLLGTLMNRFLVHRYSAQRIMAMGLVIIMLGCLLQLGFGLCLPLSLFTLVVPVGVIVFACGFIFANVMTASLQLFPKKRGSASAAQASSLVLIGSLILYGISHVQISSVLQLFPFVLAIVLVQTLLFVFSYRKVLS